VSLKNKRILITAGPTWVPIDRVRVISNIATGQTGILLAGKLAKLGAKITLLLGPTEACCISNKIRLIRFKYFKELERLIKRELGTKKYDALIHSAAVSDYRPKISYKDKVKSGILEWNLKLKSTPKIIDCIKKINPCIFLVGFKFEPAAKKEALIKKAKALMKRANADLVVANTVTKNKYKAYILNQKKICASLENRHSLADKLINSIGENL